VSCIALRVIVIVIDSAPVRWAGRCCGGCSRVIDVLSDPSAFNVFRRNARRTAIERYDLKRVCLPGQLRMLEEISLGF
jgi:hypothetical protein